MNKPFLNKRVWIASVMCLALAGCGFHRGTDDLEQMVFQTLNRTPGPIDPIPEFTEYEPFTYSSVNLRSPFDSPDDVMTAIAEVETVPPPDETRVKEFLEGFALSALRMVGSMSRDNADWVLIRDPDGTIHRVTVGNYMGRNHGRVVRTSAQTIDLIEIIPAGDDRWTERSQSIEMD